MDLIKVKLGYNRFFSSRVLLSTVAVMLSITQVGCSYPSRNLHIIEQGGIQSCGGYLVHVNPLYAYNVKNPLCKPNRTYAYDNDKREREREEATIGAMQQIDKIYNRIIGLS